MMVIGIDAATWDVIRPNIDLLPSFRKLIKEGEAGSIHLDQKPWSPSVWCSMFSGKTPEEHGHYDYVRDDEIVRREDIEVEFIWDILDRKGISVKALNVPFVVPPYNFNVDFKPVACGIPIETHELLQEIREVTAKALEVLESDKPEVFIVAYTALDRLSHLHWGEPVLLEYYQKIDSALGKLAPFDEEVVVISDHGFCDYDKAPIRTLPRTTPKGEIKGDHHPEAIVITRGIDADIYQPMDIYHLIRERYRV
jgi:predicted AlkP superfamily phosphohydrolase/phosphomutase